MLLLFSIILEAPVNLVYIVIFSIHYFVEFTVNVIYKNTVK